jgi:hypothetical protein
MTKHRQWLRQRGQWRKNVTNHELWPLSFFPVQNEKSLKIQFLTKVQLWGSSTFTSSTLTSSNHELWPLPPPPIRENVQNTIPVFTNVHTCWHNFCDVYPFSNLSFCPRKEHCWYCHGSILIPTMFFRAKRKFLTLYTTKTLGEKWWKCVTLELCSVDCLWLVEAEEVKVHDWKRSKFKMSKWKIPTIVHL